MTGKTDVQIDVHYGIQNKQRLIVKQNIVGKR